MLTPIRPSLSQALLRSGNAQAQPPVTDTGGEPTNPGLAARQAFFRQINGETAQPASAQARPAQNLTPPPRQAPQAARPITPATFKAADIERAQAQGETPPPLRPGSLLNIVV